MRHARSAHCDTARGQFVDAVSRVAQDGGDAAENRWARIAGRRPERARNPIMQDRDGSQPVSTRSAAAERGRPVGGAT